MSMPTLSRTREKTVTSTKDEHTLLMERVENYQRIIDKLQQEVQSNTVSRVGVEMLTQLLQEARQDISKVQKKARDYEAVITELQKRLINNGLSGDVHTDDMYIPGPSKQVMDALVQENSRLKRLVESTHQDPEEVVSLRQENDTLKANYNRVEMEKNACMQRVMNLEKTLSATDCGKAEEIVCLQNEIKTLSGKDKLRDSINQAMVQELKGLREEFKTMASHRMNAVPTMNANGRSEEEGQQLTQNQQATVDALMRDLDTIAEQNVALMRENCEVKEMNTRWRMHEKQRNDYVASLQSNLALMPRGEDLNRLNEVVAQNLQMEVDMEEMTRKLKELEAERDVLRSQVKFCAEDFKSERSDKDRALKKVHDLETEMLRKGKGPLTAYQHFQLDRSLAHMPQYDGSQTIPPTQRQQSSNSAGVLSTQDHHSMLDTSKGYDEVDVTHLGPPNATQK